MQISFLFLWKRTLQAHKRESAFQSLEGGRKGGGDDSQGRAVNHGSCLKLQKSFRLCTAKRYFPTNYPRIKGHISQADFSQENTQALKE